MALAASDDSTVYVAWRHLFGRNIRDIAVARSTYGGATFAGPTRVHADRWHINGCPHSGPALAVNDTGTLHLAWYTGAEGRTGVYYAQSTDGGQSFEAPTALEPDVGVSQVGLAQGRTGRVWVAWVNADRKTTVASARGGQGLDPESGLRIEDAFPGWPSHRNIRH
ncbi:sialidase family protein [Salinibacter altiplanensis]|uniref:sialidase family protein n=1 Tax=Salinibacter altiplanensis TaxID=1803181 RepID=UPI000C9ED32A|nr:sialidase family protein [Salinibacter altiplanensis]